MIDWMLKMQTPSAEVIDCLEDHTMPVFIKTKLGESPDVQDYLQVGWLLNLKTLNRAYSHSFAQARQCYRDFNTKLPNQTRTGIHPPNFKFGSQRYCSMEANPTSKVLCASREL